MRDNFKFVVAVYVLFERGDEVLLMRRNNTGWADGWHTLPAGHVEKGEHIVQSAVREAEEEAGALINPENMTLFHVSHHTYYPKGQKCIEGQCLDFFFRVGKWQGAISNREPGKCDLMEWYRRNKLPEKLLRNVRAALQKGGADDFNLMEFPLMEGEGMAA